MSLLGFSGLSKAFGLQVCFDDITGDVQDGDRIGLIGANGTGKTTLAKVLAGLQPPDDGRIERKRDLVVQYLAQEVDIEPGQTLREAAMEAFADIRDLEHRIHELSERMADPACTTEQMEVALEETGHLQHELEIRGGYVIDSRTDAVLMGLGFTKADFGKPAEGLSGGERSRVGLARVLLREPQLMILDEPTNHLDITGVQWLEGYLRDSFKGAFIVISHDRYFLDEVCTRIFELERGGLTSWRGNYSRSRELKAEELERQQRQYEQQQQEIEKQKDFIRRFGANQRARQAKGRKRRLERFIRDDAIARPTGPQAAARIEFSTDRRVGAKIVKLRDITFGYGEPLFSDVNLQVRTNEVLGIVGPNGAGKSTLLRIMTGELEPHGGSVKVGSTIKMQALGQREVFPDSDLTIMDHVRERLPKLTGKQVRDLMAALLFSGDELQKPLRVLSGGEKKRVVLAELLMSDANLLYLDEPTNHLDLPTREALEEALADFPGTIVLVSHDRYLLDRLCDRLLWLAPTTGFALPPPDDPAAAARPEHRVFPGNFTDMLDKIRSEQRERAEKRSRAEAEARAAAAAAAASKGGNQSAAKKKAEPRKRRFKGTIGELETAIETLQAQLLDVETELGAPDTYEDAARVKKLTERYDELKAELDMLETEWLERSAE